MLVGDSDSFLADNFFWNSKSRLVAVDDFWYSTFVEQHFDINADAMVDDVVMNTRAMIKMIRTRSTVGLILWSYYFWENPSSNIDGFDGGDDGQTIF